MKNIKDIQGAIFDMDGTLLSSMEAWRTVGIRYLHTFGIEPKPGIYEILHPMSLEQACEYLHAEYGTPDDFPQFLSKLNSLMNDFYKNEVQMKPGAKKILDSLKKRKIKMCIATATDRALAVQCLKRLNILDDFSAVFTCGEVGAAKTSPDIYNKALDFLGTPKDKTWVFEDALYAAETAVDAGFPVVGLFDKDSDDDQSCLMSVADIYLRDYKEWSRYFD
ncbi:MAG: HAD family hydrolase [Bacillota bacterium]|jgi:HAD superfamily hydrolase (TIGR01509 family)